MVAIFEKISFFIMRIRRMDIFKKKNMILINVDQLRRNWIDSI